MIVEWIGYFSYESLFSAFWSIKEGQSVVLVPAVSYVMLIQINSMPKWHMLALLKHMAIIWA